MADDANASPRAGGKGKMIGGSIHGEGGAALGCHNASTKLNDNVRIGASRGLMGDDIKQQIAELTKLADSSGQKKPIKHVYASPSAGANWSHREWEAYWALYEKAQGLEGCPFSEAIHDKPGEHDRPEHRHRVYLAITTRGTLVRMSNDYIKQEAVSRITEFDAAAPFIKGKHNVRAERVARELGRHDVADAMIASGLLNGTRAVAGLSPQARAQQERTGTSKGNVAAAVSSAWHHSDNGHAFQMALAETGLRLAQGDKCLVILDLTGNAHSLRRLLSMNTKMSGSEAPKEAVIRERLDGLTLPKVHEAKADHVLVTNVRTPVSPPQEPAAAVKVSIPVGEGAIANTGNQSGIPLWRVDQSTPAPNPTPDTSGSGSASSTPSAKGSVSGHYAKTLKGPGAAPGPGAHPDQIAAFRVRLGLYQTKRATQAIAQGKALQRVIRKLPQSGGVTTHANVQTQNQSSAQTSHGFDGQASAFATSSSSVSHWQGNPTRNSGGSSHGSNCREHVGTDDSANQGGERSLARGKSAVRSNMYEVGGGRHQACCHRVQLARAARALDSLNVSDLLDRLEPARVVQRIIAVECERINAQRNASPYSCPSSRDANHAACNARSVVFAPMHAARTKLTAALILQKAVLPPPWTARLVPWETASECTYRLAQEAVAIAQAELTAASPSRDKVDDAVFLACARANNAARAHAAWYKAIGQSLDRREHLLIEMADAIDGDVDLRQVILIDGLDAAIRLQAERGQRDSNEMQGLETQQTAIVGVRPR